MLNGRFSITERQKTKRTVHMDQENMKLLNEILILKDLQVDQLSNNNLEEGDALSQN